MPTNPESDLEAGLTALKLGNYYAAIRQLEPIAHNQSREDACLRAQVGLVMAYAHTGKLAKAIAWGEKLHKSANPQVQAWALRALKHLKLKYQRQIRKIAQNPQSSSGLVDKPDKTGFIPLDTSSLDNTQDRSPDTLPSDAVAESHQSINEHPESEEQIISPNLSTEDPLVYSNEIYHSTTNPIAIRWRQAKRAKVWQPLQKPNLIPSRILAFSTFMALYWVLLTTANFFASLVVLVVSRVPFVRNFPLIYADFSTFTWILLLVLLGLSPWLLDWLLTEFYGQKELTKETLNTHSREATRVLHRICQQQHWQTPQLRILPITVPIIFTYGNLPRTAHITISQGLLDQLAEDEIAVLYALSLVQIKRWDLAVMSLLLGLTLPLYILYQKVLERGNKLKGKVGREIASILASLCYGIWCLLTGAVLVNSRLRWEYCDRLAVEITGNPNGLVRAFLKIARGIAADTSKNEQTNWQLESLNIVAPIGYQQSLSLGSIMGHLPCESFLEWERTNPYRHWLTLNQTHPLMGDRIEQLCHIARQWHLDTELYFSQSPSPSKTRHTSPQDFFLQIAPWLGIPLGYLLAVLFWLIWQVAYGLHLLNLKWIYVNWSFVPGFLLIGFSIGTLMRINSLFPDITPKTWQADPHLPHLLAEPFVLPINSSGVRIRGKLLGRRGVGNYFAPDLILQSSTGLVKLHHIPLPGQSSNPQNWIGRQIIVTGWLRRGATPWIDIETLETQNGKTINSTHPILSIVLAVVAMLIGAYIILTG